MAHKEDEEDKNSDYQRLISDTVNDLPVNKQREVYHFAQYMKSKTLRRGINKRGRAKGRSIFDLFGTVRSTVTDASINHDKYLNIFHALMENGTPSGVPITVPWS